MTDFHRGVPEARFLGSAMFPFAFAATLTDLGIGGDMVLIAFGITFGGLILVPALPFGLGIQRCVPQILERRFCPEREEDAYGTVTHL